MTNRRQPKKQPEKQEICNFLKEMEKDEEKGKEEYDKLITLMSKNHPEQAGRLNINLGDEITHAATLTEIQDKLKCK